MFRRMLWRWQYARMRGFHNKNPDQYIELLNRAAKLCRRMEFNPASYQQRVRYRVTTKTHCLYELALTLERATSLVHNQLPHTDRLDVFHKPRLVRRLDRWVVDSDNVPYSEPESIGLLKPKLNGLVEALEQTRKKDDVLYAFYSYNLTYLFMDVLDVLDALLALELAINPDERLVMR